MKYDSNDQFRFEYVVRQRAAFRSYRWLYLSGAVAFAALAIAKAKSDAATFGIPDPWFAIISALGAGLFAKYALRGWRRDVDYEIFVRLCELELQRIAHETRPDNDGRDAAATAQR